MTVTTLIDAAPRQLSRRWWVLAVTAAAQFMYVADAFVVNVGLPSIRADLGASVGETEGIIVFYLLAYAALVVTGGRLGDIYGARRVFVTGLTAFTLASLWCALSGSGSELVLARTLQGAAAAMMVPQVLSTIQRLFQGEERGRAFGIYGTTLGLGAAFGFGLGGLLVSFDAAHVGWRSIFFINVPVGVPLIAAALWLMPPAERRAEVSLDVAGAGILFLTLLCLLGPVVLSHDISQPYWLLAVMAIGVVLLAAFWRTEGAVERGGRLPLVPVELLRDRTLVAGFLAVLFFAFANLAFYLAVTFYMQFGLRYSALGSGSVVLPLALAFSVASRLAAGRAQRRGVAALLEGCAVQLGGLVLLGAVTALTTPQPWLLATLLVVFGIGQGMLMAPLYSHVLARVPAGHAGSGAGLISMVQQIGNGTGVATVGALYFAIQAHASDRAAFLAALVLLAVALAVTAALLAGPAGGRTPSRAQ